MSDYFSEQFTYEQVEHWDFHRVYDELQARDKEIADLKDRLEQLEYYVNDFTNVCFRTAKQFAEDIN